MRQYRPVDELTPREQEVMSLLAHGLTNAEIGHQLGMTDRTARTHLSNIFTKLHVHNRTELAIYVLRQELEQARAEIETLRAGIAEIQKEFKAVEHFFKRGIETLSRLGADDA